MSEYIVYDNSLVPGEIIQEVIGNKGFGDVVVKRKKLRDVYKENISQLFPKMKWYEINKLYDVDEIISKIKKREEDKKDRILHCFSNYIFVDQAKAELTLKKLPFIQENILVMDQGILCAIMFSDKMQYIDFLESCVENQSVGKAVEILNYGKIDIQGMKFIGNINSFIQCITGNFDSRYFNSLQGTDFQLRKKSTNKKKIKSEYEYYHLLPERMQHWFVMPFDYQEDEKTSSYAMERLHMTDIAIKWVHGSIGVNEFKDLMDMYFFFFKERSEKIISEEEYTAISTKLYITKVKERIEELVKLEKYKNINQLLQSNEKIGSIERIFDWYMELKNKVEARKSYPMKSVIGHGDPCFANAMYNRATRMLKFIDPKGALCEADLWTNPYYDIAKLSHSICGNYDFFNNALFDITIDDSFDYVLSIPFDNTPYKRIFREYVEENGYDYWTVRIYEASLFLSMLPLHMDYPHKVFGFILNAINILKEIEENV